jgi:hypothetical protein
MTNLQLKRPSIAAMCASRDKHFNKYYTTVRLQASGKELLVGEKDNMTSMVEEVCPFSSPLRPFLPQCLLLSLYYS